MQEEKECLTKGIEHRYEFIKAEFGNMNFICRNCGDWINEVEDCTP